MEPERWQQIEALFQRALEHPPEQRADFVSAECAGNESMRREIETLLAFHDDGRSFDASVVVADLIEERDADVAVGRAVGPYRVLRLLASGGMGKVFLAQDTKLSRPIALKLLHPEFTSDSDRLRRFEQEARAASALNHPNIVTVYDIGRDLDFHFIAMEFVDGQTLRQMLARGRMRLNEALDVASQIASALTAAHAANIVHRDIKPENILVRRDGYIKVVDFGLAKLMEMRASAVAAVHTPTVIATPAGIVVGTPNYMSPEQVRGADSDCRSDIFSFGTLLYEMLGGRRAFDAVTAVEAMNAVLNEEPPRLPPDVPAPLQRIVARCLEKRPERRFQSTEDLTFAIRALSGESTGIEPKPAAFHRLSWGWWITAAVVLTLLFTAWGVSLRQPDLSWNNPLQNARFEKLTDFEGVESNAAISADGKFVAFLSDRDGPLDLWLTQIGSGQFRNLTRGRFTGLSTEVVANVGFSGDGSQVWFNAFDGNGSRDVWLIPTIGGAPHIFLPRGVHAAWSPNGNKMLFTEAGSGDPLYVADRDGSNPKRLFQDQSGYHIHYPTWSLDGQYIYFVRGVNFTRQMDVWRIPAVGGNPERITSQYTWSVFPTFLDRRTLLYTTLAEDGSGPWLYAIDVDRRRPHRINLGVERYTSVSAAADGRRLVATVTNPVTRLWKIPILRRPAQESEASTIELPNVRALGPRYGPDYFVYVGSQGGSEGLWKFEKGEASPLWKGSQSGRISSPAVSEDGDQVAFTVRRQGRGTLYAMSARGTGVRTLSGSLDVSGVPCWSPDAKWIAVIADAGQGPRLFKLPIGGGPPVQLTNEPAWNPIWSPHGGLIVYSGAQVRSRVPLRAVRPDGKSVRFPRDVWILPMDERYRFLPGGRALVVVNGDFKTLQFFLLDLETFQERALSNLQPGFTMRSFDVSPDGKYVLFDRVADTSDIVLIEIDR